MKSKDVYIECENCAGKIIIPIMPVETPSSNFFYLKFVREQQPEWLDSIDIDPYRKILKQC
jgi:hypothetical protein